MFAKVLLKAIDPNTNTEYRFIMSTNSDYVTIAIEDLSTKVSKAHAYDTISEAYDDWSKIMKSIVFGYGTPETHLGYIKRDEHYDWK